MEIKLSARNALIEIYMDYVNNYLSPAIFAEHNGLTEQQALSLLDLCRSVYNSPHPDL